MWRTLVSDEKPLLASHTLFEFIELYVFQFQFTVLVKNDKEKTCGQFYILSVCSQQNRI